MSKKNKVLAVLCNPSQNLPGSSITPSIKRLSSWFEEAGIEEWEYTNAHLEVTSGNSSPSVSDEDLRRLKSKEKEYLKIFSFGNVAHNALKKADVEHERFTHPSPRNRKLNDPEFEKQEIIKMRKCIRG